MVNASTVADITCLQHIGITVSDVDETLAFWSALLGVDPLWRRTLDGAYLSDVTGYPGVVLDAGMIELPGGAMLEVLDYRVAEKQANDMATANPGNVHIAIRVIDIDSVWQRAIDAGGLAVSPAPVTVTSGPNTGAKACYLRDPNGVTLELIQPPN
ncbi:MAG: VOC family protein [Acidimicrobiia bacterium]|nr:VOC family protein [Acidimicrobiia bacterium]